MKEGPRLAWHQLWGTVISISAVAPVGTDPRPETTGGE